MFIYIYIYKNLVGRVFANNSDQASIPGRVIPKIQKMVLMPPCLTLSIIRYGSRVKWYNPKKVVAPFPTLQYSSCLNGSLWVALNYGRQLYLLLLWIIIIISYLKPYNCVQKRNL